MWLQIGDIVLYHIGKTITPAIVTGFGEIKDTLHIALIRRDSSYLMHREDVPFAGNWPEGDISYKWSLPKKR